MRSSGPAGRQDFCLFKVGAGGCFLFVGWVAVLVLDEHADVGPDVSSLGPVDGDVVADGFDQLAGDAALGFRRLMELNVLLSNP